MNAPRVDRAGPARVGREARTTPAPRLPSVGGRPYRARVGQGNGRRGRAGDVVLPIVAAALPTAVFQVPNLVGVPVGRAWLVVSALAVFVAVVVWQVLRARRGARARASAEDTGAAALAAYEVAVQYGFGQIASRLTRFATHDPVTRRIELGGFADRAAAALAFYLLPHVPDVRANVYLLSPTLDALEPIGHGGAGDTAGTFRAGTPYGDRNLEWVLQGGPPRVVPDRESDVDAEDDDPEFAPRWRSYVAVVVRSEDYSFGMLTVDSPAPGAFTELDVRNVAVIAEYVATACVLAFRPVPDTVSDPGPGPVAGADPVAGARPVAGPESVADPAPGPLSGPRRSLTP
jgi:hypothetical protein